MLRFVAAAEVNDQERSSQYFGGAAACTGIAATVVVVNWPTPRNHKRAAHSNWVGSSLAVSPSAISHLCLPSPDTIFAIISVGFQLPWRVAADVGSLETKHWLSMPKENLASAASATIPSLLKGSRRRERRVAAANETKLKPADVKSMASGNTHGSVMPSVKTSRVVRQTRGTGTSTNPQCAEIERPDDTEQLIQDGRESGVAGSGILWRRTTLRQNPFARRRSSATRSLRGDASNINLLDRQTWSGGRLIGSISTIILNQPANDRRRAA